MKIDSLDTVIASPSNCYPSVDIDTNLDIMGVEQLDKFIQLNSNLPSFIPYNATFAKISATGWKDPQLPEMDSIIDHCKKYYEYNLTNIMLGKFGCSNIPQNIIDRFNKYSQMNQKHLKNKHNCMENPFDDDFDENMSSKVVVDFMNHRFFDHDYAQNHYILRDVLLYNITNIYKYIGHYCIHYLLKNTPKLSSELSMLKFTLHDDGDNASKPTKLESYKRCVRMLACVTLAAQQHGIKIPIPQHLSSDNLFKLCIANIHKSALHNNFSQQGDPVKLILDSWGIGYQEITPELLDQINGSMVAARVQKQSVFYRSVFKDTFSLVAAPYDPKLSEFQQPDFRNPREKDICEDSYRSWYASALSLLPHSHSSHISNYIARELCVEWRRDLGRHFGWAEISGEDTCQHMVTVANRMGFTFDEVIGSYYNINKTNALWALTKFRDLYMSGLKLGPKGEKLLLMTQIKSANISDTQNYRVSEIIDEMIKKGDLDGEKTEE